MARDLTVKRFLKIALTEENLVAFSISGKEKKNLQSYNSKSRSNKKNIRSTWLKNFHDKSNHQ